MKTIEEYEIEISSKISLATEGMQKFNDNISRIGSVIGRDTSEVYSVLNNALVLSVDRFNTMALKNADTLQPIVDKLDKILNVLAEVISSIDKIEQAANDNTASLDVRNDVTNAMIKASEDVDSLIDIIPSTAVDSTFIKNPEIAIVSGLAAFFISKEIAKLGTLASIAIACGAAYFVGNTITGKD